MTHKVHAEWFGPGPWGKACQGSKRFPCDRCEGGGYIAVAGPACALVQGGQKPGEALEDGSPWRAWSSLPLESSHAVLMGLVAPGICPDCDGTGTDRKAEDAAARLEAEQPARR